MTECTRDDMRDLLPDLLNERLDLGARSDVARHVASCPACAAELELLRAMRSTLSPAPRVDVARIAAAVHAARGASAPSPTVRPLVPRRSGWDARRMAWQIAAAVVIAAIGTWAVTHRQPASEVAVIDSIPKQGGAPAQTAPNVAVNPAAPAAHPAAAVKTPPKPTQMLASTGRRGLIMDGGVNDLSDGDVRMLLQSLDSLTTIPDADPTPMSYQIDDGGGVQ